MKMGSSGLNNFFLLDQVKGHCGLLTSEQQSGGYLCGEIPHHIHHISSPKREKTLKKKVQIELFLKFSQLACSLLTLLKQSTTPLYLSAAAMPLCASWLRDNGISWWQKTIAIHSGVTWDKIKAKKGIHSSHVQAFENHSVVTQSLT